MIVIVDFGSQTTHLISRRLKNLGVASKIINPFSLEKAILSLKPKGIILSGGPSSVYQKNAPLIDKKFFFFNIPILGICYGWQLTAKVLGGKVQPTKNEYGPKKLKLKTKIENEIVSGLPHEFIVWLSHGDTVVQLPKGFKVIGSTDSVKNAWVADFEKKIFGVQFHPEVSHTEFGEKILENFAIKICRVKSIKQSLSLKKIIQDLRQKVGSNKVIGAVSGGIDSTVAGILLSKAIGKNFYPVYIESGLMRPDTAKEVKKIFKNFAKVKVKIINAKNIFLKKLKGVKNPEKKRKIIGYLYAKLFEKEAKKIKDAKFLLQGTIYSDVIESKGTKLADKIKSHHNVAALPKDLNLKIIEPLRYFYKDEVRELARKLKLPKDLINKHPFPGPGYAIRILGEVTEKRLRKIKKIDQILLEELKKAGWYDKVFQAFPVLTGIKSTAVKGDSRSYQEVVALRIYQSDDVMSASVARLPYHLLQKITTRIVNEVADVSRVVYDITTKPPATMEWE